MRHKAPRFRLLLALLLGGGLAGLTRAQQPQLEITRLDGHVDAGTLVSLTPEISIALAEGVLSLPWSDVLMVRPAAAGPSSEPPGPLPLELALGDGSILACEITNGEQDRIELRLSGGQECRLELSEVRSVRVASAPPAAQTRLAELLHAPGSAADETEAENGKEATDAAVVARGTEVVVLRGRILEIGPERVLVNWNDREVPVPWARLGGLVFARPTLRRAPCIVRLNGGDAFAGQVVGGTAGWLKLRSDAFADELQIPWTSVERIDCQSERLVVLTDLKPVRYEFEPFFDKTWNYATDATLTGQPIRLGGRTFARGLTMHSRSRLVYALDRPCERFTAAAGILDEMGRRGCVTLRVRGDGRVLWSASGVRGGEPPREVSVEIGGIRELTLEVDYDADLDLSDHAAWGFARLIR